MKLPFDRADVRQQVAAHRLGSSASARATSGPVMRPVTAMLPPKNSFRTGAPRRPSTSRARSSMGASTAAP